MIVNTHRWITAAEYVDWRETNEYGLRMLEMDDPDQDLPDEAFGVYIAESADDILKSLSGNENIIAVNIDLTGIHQEGIDALSTLPNLYALSLLNAFGFKGNELAALSRNSSLRELSIGESCKEWDFLSSLKNLQVLITGSAGDDMAERLPALSHLCELKVHFGNMTEAGLKNISRCHSLEGLSLHNIKADSESYGKLSALQKLRFLVIHGHSSWPSDTPESEQSVSVDDNCIHAFEKLPLQGLFLEKCRITDVSLKSVRKIEALNKLVLNQCPFLTEKCLDFLQNVNFAYNIEVREDKSEDSEDWSLYEHPRENRRFRIDDLKPLIGKSVKVELTHGIIAEGVLREVFEDDYLVLLKDEGSQLGMTISIESIVNIKIDLQNK